MRGRLINPFFAKIARLNTIETQEDPDGAGVETSGYDDDFREPIVIDDTDPVTNERTITRKEFPTVLVPCQVESNLFEQLQQFAAGGEPTTDLVLVFHFADLEKADMIDTQNNARIRLNDRLVAICQRCNGKLEQTIPVDGFYCVHSQPSSFGLGRRRNLLITRWRDRERSVRVA